MLISEKYHLKRLAADIFASGVNLAERFPEWITLMYSLAGGGEDLLDSFLRLASLGSTYKQKENRRAFLHATTVSSDDSLAWFLKTAKSLGYNLDDYLTPEGWQDREEFIRQHSRGTQEGRANTAKRMKIETANKHTPCDKQGNPLTKIEGRGESLNLIAPQFIQKCRSNSSVFVQSLVSTGLLTPEKAAAAADLYHLGAMRDGSVIFWQIDQQGQVREGKIMLYGPDCHRIKTSGAQWMGWMMRYKLKGVDGKFLLPQDWKATQCLFGEHLLDAANNSSLLTPHSSLNLVCVVEAEKTAVILSQLMPDKLWLAAGGEQALSVQKLAALKGHKIILYPDTDPHGATFAHWQQISNEARLQHGLNISISNLLETHASADQKERKIDLVDFLTESEEVGVRSEECPAAPNSSHDVANNSTLHTPHSSLREDPLLADLIEAFDLVEVNP